MTATGAMHEATGRAAADQVFTPRLDSMRRLAERWRQEAKERADRYRTDGIVWKSMNYLLVLATAAGGAGGGTALGGGPRWIAACFAFVAGGAAALATPAANEVAAQRAKKVRWRQVGREIDVFLTVTLPNDTPDAVSTAFGALEQSMLSADATQSA